MRTNEGRLARLRRRLLPLGFLLAVLAVQVAGSSPTFRIDDASLRSADGTMAAAHITYRPA